MIYALISEWARYNPPPKFTSLRVSSRDCAGILGVRGVAAQVRGDARVSWCLLMRGVFGNAISFSVIHRFNLPISHGQQSLQILNFPNAELPQSRKDRHCTPKVERIAKINLALTDHNPVLFSANS